MKGSGHADHRGGGADLCPHGVLSGIDVCQHRRQRPVVPDGAGQHEGHVVLHAAVDDAVVDVVILDKLRNGPAAADLVQHIQVVIVAVGLGLLGIDILT